MSGSEPVMLFGDSMLGRFTRPRIQHLERELGGRATVYNCAAGGWDSDDGAERAAFLGGLSWAAVVLSFGGNDCAPWRRVPLDRFAANVAGIVDAFAETPVVAFLGPRVREIDRPGLGMRLNRELDVYRDMLREAVGADACLETHRLLAFDEGPDPLEPDGVHLTADSYTTLIPSLARLIARTLDGSGRQAGPAR